MSAPVEPEKLTFIHVFNRKLRCTLTSPNHPPTNGSLAFKIQWSGQPKKKHFNEYRRWVLGVNQTLVDRWGKSVLYALGVAKNRTELWAFEPGKAPKLESVIPVGIP